MQHKRRRKRRGAAQQGEDNPLDQAVNQRDRSTLDMVAEAVRHKNTLLAYQPVVAARRPGQTAFYEGYIRLLDETGRVIPAGQFMGAIEDTELARDIDVLALEAGLGALAKARDLRLSINMSARSIGYSRWMRVLNRRLKRDPTIAERLILEITEHSAMTVPELVMDFMDQLQGRGIAFALDDFGAGQTTFRHFRDFFFDLVKIDGRFVAGIHEHPENQALVRALVGIAQQFDMFCVAERVETQAEADWLTAIGVDCLQGFLFGAPAVRPPWDDAGDQSADQAGESRKSA
ncbi:MAG: EAL domain-containing protein [Marinibacterium sp.]|nr:EAL domain-containing protein [Marinibacterium sp.]